MFNKTADLLEYCILEDGCGLCPKFHNDCPGERKLKLEASKLIRDLDSIIPHTCATCVGCEIEGVDSINCEHFILSPERAKYYIHALTRK